MRVLVVVHGFPPLAQGGAEIYADQHARALVRLHGDDVAVLTREQDRQRPEYGVRTEHRDGLRITWVNNTFREVRTYAESYLNPRVDAIATSLIDEFQPDVAHVHHLTCLSTGIVTLLASRGIPIFFTLHDYWLLCHRGQLLDVHYQLCAGPEPEGCRNCLGFAATPVPGGLVPTLRAVERQLPRAVASAARGLAAAVSAATAGGAEAHAAARLRFEHMRAVCGEVTCFLAPSQSIRDRFVRFGIDPERIAVEPYGFERSRFAQRVDKGRPEGRPLRLGFLGTLMASKAPHVLLEAHRGLPPGLATVDLFGAQADYHGDASYRHVLEPFLSCPDVRMRGPQPHARVAEALAALDVLVVPSVWPETSPLVIREAFLAGVPVVASRIGGIPELIVDGENGLLFAPGDVEDLRRTLLRLLEEADLLATLKAGAATTSVRTLADDVHTVRRRYAAGAARRVRAASHRRLAAVVLNFRTAADTALAVASLMASDRPPDELIVVDNDQDGACRSAITRWGSAVTYLPTVRNLGFSGGMNVGIQRALANGADHVLLVNSDVVVSPHCIAHLERALTAEGVGIVGPLVLSRASPDRVGSAGIDYSLRSGRMRHRSAHVPAGGREWADDDVDAVSGCLVLIGRAVFERIGLLDERYFFGFEDIEFCLRARRSGFHTRLVGRAAAYHEGGQAIGAESPRRLYYAARNHLLLARDTGDGDGRAAQVFRMATVSLLNMAHAAKAPGGSLPARLGATLQGIRDYAGRRFGPDAAN